MEGMMRWFSKTQEQEEKETRERLEVSAKQINTEDWKDWWAWYPVRIGNIKIWREIVQYKEKVWVQWDDYAGRWSLNGNILYREKEKTHDHPNPSADRGGGKSDMR